MKEIVLRDFLRNYKQYLPIPPEGIKIVCRDGDDLYLYNQPKENIDKLRVIAKFIVSEMRSELQEPLAQSIPAQTVNLCEAHLLLSWEKQCQSEGSEYLVANLKDGEPMSESDWKHLFLCDIHREVVKTVGGFELETP